MTVYYVYAYQKKRETLFTPEHFTNYFFRSSSVKNSFLSSVFSFPPPAPTTKDERESKSKKEEEEIRTKKKNSRRKEWPGQKKIRLFVERNQKIYISARCKHFRHKTTHVL